MARLKTGVLISGRGTNLAALLDACADAKFPAEIALVISNQGDAAGLGRAKSAGCATLVIEHTDFPGRGAFDDAIGAALDAAGIELVCLAGFMRILSKAFVERWRDRIINIHPSLLPAFKGLDAQAQALAAGVRISGCTVHFVRPAMDAGPIIVQTEVPVKAGDDADTLAARILEAEHVIYPQALRLIAEGRVRIEGEAVVIDGAQAAAGALVNPCVPEIGGS